MDCPTCHVSVPRNDFRRCVVLDQVCTCSSFRSGGDGLSDFVRVKRPQIPAGVDIIVLRILVLRALCAAGFVCDITALMMWKPIARWLARRRSLERYVKVFAPSHHREFRAFWSVQHRPDVPYLSLFHVYSNQLFPARAYSTI